MKHRNACLFFCGFLFVANVLLSACQSGSSPLDEEPLATTPVTVDSVPETPTMAPQPTVLEPQEETTDATSEGGLIINEEVRRSALFNINTLAHELPGMEDVEVINITYAFHENQPLTMDVYYPPGTPVGAQLPVVVFGLGYRMSSESLRDAHFYTSWGRLVAAAGMVGISYDTEQPDRDLETLMVFIKDNAMALRIDPTQIGLMSTSANVPTVMSYLMQEGRTGIQFAVYYYGYSLTPDHKYTEAFGESCAQRGCLVNELADVTYVDPDLPLFIVKAGRDFVPNINEAWDHFVAFVREAGAPVTVVEYEDGRHGFDTQQKTEESAEIIAQTVDFMKTNFGLDH